MCLLRDLFWCQGIDRGSLRRVIPRNSAISTPLASQRRPNSLHIPRSESCSCRACHMEEAQEWLQHQASRLQMLGRPLSCQVTQCCDLLLAWYCEKYCMHLLHHTLATTGMYLHTIIFEARLVQEGAIGSTK
jgi:hypothetical protein